MEPHYAMQMYERYGGLCQTYPLTPEEQKYDDTCREIDSLEVEIWEMSAGLFKAHELMWFNHFVSKLWVFPKQDQLDHQLEVLRGLLATLKSRM